VDSIDALLPFPGPTRISKRHTPRSNPCGQAARLAIETPVKPVLTALLLLCLAGCMGPDREPVIGEAYCGPATLNLRLELAPKSPVSATVRHGERLSVLATRRRFIKVRTKDDKEGWVDGYALLTTQQMDDLRMLAERAQQLPSQGMARAYDLLNMHTDPSRQSPSFYQIPEKGQVDIIGHRVSPRGRVATVPPVALAVKAEQPVPRRRRQKAQKAGPPPMPPGPKLPINWLALSSVRDDPNPEIGTPAPPPVPSVRLNPLLALPEKTEAEKANVLEDWSLVRTHDGRVGWALQRYLVMSIPDEVAQYAEGHRITSYFSLGEVRDRERDFVKHNWFWTTIKKRAENYQFDAIRVFTWNTRRHRYETAFRETGIRGYYPVTARTSPQTEFTLIVEEEPGQYFKKTYTFNGFQVRVTNRETAQLPEDKDLRAAPLSIAFAETLNPPDRTWMDRTKDSFGKRWKNWFK